MSCTAKHEKDKQTILVKWQWVQVGSEPTTTTTVLLLPTSGKSPGWKPSFFPAFLDRGTSNHVHVCMKACWDDGLATAPKSRSLKTLLMQRVTLLGAAQLPVSTYWTVWHTVTIPHVRAVCHPAFICQPTNACTGMLQLSREYMTQCMYLGMDSVGSLASVLRYWGR